MLLAGSCCGWSGAEAGEEEAHKILTAKSWFFITDVKRIVINSADGDRQNRHKCTFIDLFSIIVIDNCYLSRRVERKKEANDAFKLYHDAARFGEFL